MLFRALDSSGSGQRNGNDVNGPLVCITRDEFSGWLTSGLMRLFEHYIGWNFQTLSSGQFYETMYPPQ